MKIGHGGRIPRFVGVAVGVAFLAAAPGAGSVDEDVPLPLEPESRVNLLTSSSQLASVARDPFGGFVVVWTGLAAGAGAPDYDVFARRFTGGGIALGPELTVNTTTSGFQSGRAIGIDALGNFVVAWSDQGPLNGSAVIKARRYLGDGEPAALEFTVSSNPVGVQFGPSLAMRPDGGYVITWVGAPNGNDLDIYRRTFGPDGAPEGDDERVNTFLADVQDNPEAAFAADGTSIVAWESYAQDLPDGEAPYEDGRGVYAQRFSADGTPAGNEFRVAETVLGYQARPSVSSGPDGSFTIAWDGAGVGGDGEDVWLRRFAADGTPLTGELRINATLDGPQLEPVLAGDAAGNFVAVWTGATTDGSEQGVYGEGIYGQRFAADAAASGSEFRIDNLPGDPSRPGVASMDADGDFVTVWESRNWSDPEDPNAHVYMKRFRGPEAVDLGVTVDVDVEAVAAGTTVDFEIEVSSEHAPEVGIGVGAGSGVEVELVVSAGSTIVSTEGGDSWDCTVGAPTTCVFTAPVEAAGVADPLVVTVTAPSGGSLAKASAPVTLTATMTSDQLDPATGNNTGASAVAVGPPVANGGSGGGGALALDLLAGLFFMRRLRRPL